MYVFYYMFLYFNHWFLRFQKSNALVGLDDGIEEDTFWYFVGCHLWRKNYLYRCMLRAEYNWHPWWRRQMETFFALLDICAGDSPVPVNSPHKCPVPVNSPHKCQWRGALMFSLICVWIIGWVSYREAGDLRRYPAHSAVTVMHWNIWLGVVRIFCSCSITSLILRPFIEHSPHKSILNVTAKQLPECYRYNILCVLLSQPFHALIWSCT